MLVRDDDRPIALRALELARANIGVVEVGNNAGAAVRAYQESCVPPLPAGSPWCAAVVRFRLKQAATALGLVYDKTFPRTGWTPDYSRWAKQNNKWVSVSSARIMSEDGIKLVLKPGDLGLFYFSSLGRIGHIGVIEEVNDWGVVMIEGNTSPEPSYADEVERDGDGYYRKVRHWAEFGKFGGFVQIDF
jgi:hypothetical protein